MTHRKNMKRLLVSILLTISVSGFCQTSLKKVASVSAQATVETGINQESLVNFILEKTSFNDIEKSIADYNKDKEINVADITWYISSLFTDFEESVNGHDYVDLGFVDEEGNTILWATCNIGATSTNQYGNLYAWGELQTKQTYTKENYSFYETGYSDSKLSVNDDVATQSWGGNWRMPTNGEFEQLFNNCTYTWEQNNGINGYTFTSKINGNSIFLPAAGVSHSSTGIPTYFGTFGYYWGSEKYGSVTQSYRVAFNKDGFFNHNGERYLGQSVRAVCTVKSTMPTPTPNPDSPFILIFNGEDDEVANPYLDVLAPKREAAGGFEE